MRVDPPVVTYRTPIEGTADALVKQLGARPLFWIGAGTSIAAGYPSTAKLVRTLIQKADDPIPSTLSFPEVVDRFVDSMGPGALAGLLEELFREPRQPTELHRAAARLAGAGRLHSIITTNYDPLIERALSNAGVKHVVQSLNQNETLGEDTFRVLKLHGSQEDWRRVILSGKSYAEFHQRYDFLCKQLDVLLRRRPVVFAGFSMTDTRILDWLASLPADWEDLLFPWRPVMTQAEWDTAVEASRKVAGGRHPLARGNIRPLVVADHGRLPALWKEAEDRLAPIVSGLERLTLDVTVRPDSWQLETAGCPPWTTPEPLAADRTLKKDLERLRQLDSTPLPTREDGSLSPDAAATRAVLEQLAESVGERLTRVLLSEEARARVALAVRAGQGGSPPLLHVRVRPETPGPEGEARADAALALPWELLRLEGRFPVKEGALDVAREAVVEGLAGLDAPTKELTVVATVAAPEDATALDSEDECFRLWLALGEAERRLLLTDVGTLDAFVNAVVHHRPVAVHFTGHGEPGTLLFEDEAAYQAPVAVKELRPRLQGGALPRFFYLACCHGASSEGGAAAPGAGVAARVADPAVLKPGAPSSAASLHRAGFPQVVAYFGPVGDAQSTRMETVVYRALVQGQTAREAVRRARLEAFKVHKSPAGAATHVYPLGWAQLALYHRGEDWPVALPATVRGGEDFLAAERRREVELLDKAGGAEGVHGLQRGFVGRRSSRAQLVRRWKQGERLAVVVGLGGLGKTALCTEALPILGRLQGAEQLVLNGRAAGAAADAVAALWEQVQAARTEARWGEELARLQEKGLTAEALVGALRWLAKKQGGLLVYLDDAESLQRPVPEGTLGRWRDAALERLWSLLVAEARPGGRFGLLVSARYLPAGTPDPSHLPLEPMRTMDVVRLLRWHDTLGRLPPVEAEWVAQMVDGHPRTVEYLEALASRQEQAVAGPGARYTGARWREEVLAKVLPETLAKVDANLLLGLLWKALSPETREHLGQCSVVVSAAPWQAIVHLGTERTARELAQAGLLSPGPMSGTREKGWAPHLLVLKEVWKHWSGDRKAVNTRLGQWYAERPDAERTLYSDTQAVDCLVAAQDGNAAWPPARRLILALRRPGRYREALRLCERVLEAGPTGASRGIALAFQVQLCGCLAEPLEDSEDRLREAANLGGAESRILVLNELGLLYWRQGKFSAAVKALGESVATAVAVHGTEEHPSVAASLHALAMVLHVQGDLPAARETLERSLAIDARHFGTEEHPSVAASLHALAMVLHAQGDLPAAREALERSLAINARHFGTEEHPNMAASLHVLAGVLRAQGDLPAAREMLERSLAIHSRVFGTEEHPDVAASLRELARVLLAQGDLPAARKRLERSLAIHSRVFGTEEHPSVAASLHALAMVLHVQGDLPAAREKLERSLAICARVFGTEEHPDMAASLHELARVLLAQGDLPAAREKLERSLATRARVFGTEEHPDVAASLHELAGVLLAQGNLPAAREKLERSLAIHARIFGTEEHPDVAVSLHSLARVLQAQGDLPAARDKLERVLTINLKVYGTRDHHSTAMTEVGLASLLIQTGEEPKRTDELLDHAYRVFVAQLGPDHPSTRRTAKLLGR